MISLIRTALAFVAVSSVGVGAAFGAPIDIIATAPVAGVGSSADSFLGTNGTNWGGTTFFNVAPTLVTGYGSFSSHKDDGGVGVGHVDATLTNPTLETALFQFDKSGYASNSGNGTWSSGSGEIFFDLDYSTDYTVDSVITSTATTNWAWVLSVYDSGSGSFVTVDTLGNPVYGSTSGSPVAQATHAGTLGPGLYGFQFSSRNQSPGAFGNPLDQSFTLGLTASVPEPATISLVLLSLLGVRLRRR